MSRSNPADDDLAAMRERDIRYLTDSGMSRDVAIELLDDYERRMDAAIRQALGEP